MSDEWQVGWWRDGMPQRLTSDWGSPARGTAVELGSRAYNSLLIENRTLPVPPQAPAEVDAAAPTLDLS